MCFEKVDLKGYVSDAIDFGLVNDLDYGKGNPFGANGPDGMVWHQTQYDGKTQLMPKDIYDAVKPTGGAAVCGARSKP